MKSTICAEKPRRIYTAPFPWTNGVQARPMDDLRRVRIAMRGCDADFGAPATAYMNEFTFTAMTMNVNPCDLYGRRAQAAEENGEDEASYRIRGGPLPVGRMTQIVNEILNNDNLPSIAIDVNRLNGEVLVVGKRIGLPDGKSHTVTMYV